MTHWDYLLSGPPPLFVMDRFPIVLWSTAATFLDTLSGDDEGLLADYLEGGSALILSSQDYLGDRGVTPFAQDYLHAVKLHRRLVSYTDGGHRELL